VSSYATANREIVEVSLSSSVFTVQQYSSATINQ
jgi:hypothetical protein